MSATVSTRWFWSDWMSDPCLRACGYAARGLWKDLLCIAGSNKKEYGYVSLNGHKLTDAAIARMTNGSESEVTELLSELEQNGVFNRDRRGIIYCRRMIRAEKNRSNGRLGGNPNLMKNKEKENPVQPTSKPLIPEPEPKPKPESKISAPDGAAARPKKSRTRSAIPDDAKISAAQKDHALGRGIHPSRVDVIFEKFKNYYIGHGKLMADWNATWRNWITNELDRNPAPVQKQSSWVQGDDFG